MCTHIYTKKAVYVIYNNTGHSSILDFFILQYKYYCYILLFFNLINSYTKYKVLHNFSNII